MLHAVWQDLTLILRDFLIGQIINIIFLDGNVLFNLAVTDFAEIQSKNFAQPLGALKALLHKNALSDICMWSMKNHPLIWCREV